MAPPVRVVLNPASSSGKAGRLRHRIETYLSGRGIEFDLRLTRGPGHAVDLAREAVEAGVQTVVAVGGDGTVHEVVRGLLGSSIDERSPEGKGGSALDERPSLAVVPVGTGNDFYRMVGTSGEPEDALTVLERGRRRLFDVGVVRWEGGCRPFVNLLGVGVDVEVLRRREGFRHLRGLAQYLTALLVAVLRFRPFEVRIRIDDREEIAGRAHLAAITVGPSAGGGFLLNPGATPDDGRLDLCFVDALSYLEVVRYLPRIVRGNHQDLDVVRLRRLRRARIERSDGRPLEFELDGELMDDPVSWLEVSIEARCLPVLAPGRRDPQPEAPVDTRAPASGDPS